MTKNLFSKIEKVVVNVGVGRASSVPNFAEKHLPDILKDLAAITGQKPAPRSAKKSIAGFKMRSGTVVGLQVTLRRQKMRDFIAKLLHAVLPRVRDFRGIPKKSVSTGGVLSIGLKEHQVFPEVIPEQTTANFGVEISVVPRKEFRTKERAFDVFKEVGIPFEK